MKLHRWAPVAGSFLVLALLAFLHFGQAAALGRALEALTQFQISRTELAQGFLAVNLAGLPGAPKDRGQGLALLAQAEASLRDFEAHWDQVAADDPVLSDLVLQYRSRSPRLQELLSVGDGTELRVAYFALQRLGDRIEVRTRQAGLDLQNRLLVEFLSALAVSLGAIGILSALFLRVSRSRDLAQTQLEEASLRLDQVTRGARVGLWHRRFDQGQTQVNGTWKVLLGLAEDAPVPSQTLWFDRMHPEDRGRMQEVVKQFQDENLDQWQGSYRVILPGGELRWLLTRVSAERDEKGRAVGQFGVNLDITDLKRLEDEKTRLEGEVAQSQKNDALGRMAGGIAHDLNNLLVPLLNYSDLGLKSTTKPPAHYFERIKAVAERAADLTRRILAFSRRQVLEKRSVDLAALVKDFDPILRRLVPETMVLEVRIQDPLPRTVADPGQVEQVILNLVVNARDALAPGGLVVISLRPSGPGEGEEPSVVLEVADNGQGIGADILPRIFEPFFSTKPRGQGTGLGLATVQGIVHQHGGRITVESKAGAGTVVRVFWPAEAPGTEAASTPAPVSPAAAGGAETILVVEDEETVREVVREALEGRGYRVFTAAGPDEALKVAEDYDLLVTDVVMPGMNGRELWDTLAPARPRLRVLFMSGYADRVLMGADRTGPGQDFLQKPFSVDVLGRKVRALLDQVPAALPPG